VAITRISAPYAATESHHFSDRNRSPMTRLLYALAHVRSFGVTENLQPVHMVNLKLVSIVEEQSTVGAASALLFDR
jgi:hypothetical protein